MRTKFARDITMRRPLAAALLTATSLGISGCATAFSPDWVSKLSTFSLPSLLEDREALADAGDEKRESDDLVGSRVSVSGITAPVLEGVGLITGLDGTGGDVPPSSYRRMILEDMRKRRVISPEKLLQSPTTAIVVVRAYLPPLAKKGDPLDLEIRVPGGSEVTSLKGGYLLPCDLYEQGFVAGRGQMNNHKSGIASGPILISTGNDKDLQNAGVVRRGTVPGGGKYTGDTRTLSLNLRSEYRGARNSRRIAEQIGKRFHGFDEYGISKPLADAKTDTRIELRVPDVYVDNFPRFLKVVRRVAVSETPIETRVRMERLREDLLIPSKSEEAALQLEAIGRDATTHLLQALSAESLFCRFQAAVSLAYLGDATGAEVLGEAAATDRALRVWALLAMSCLDGGEAIPELVKLIDSESIETRYGAVRALTTIDDRHPAIRGIDVTDRCKLRVLESTGAPMVHLTKSQKSEITLFGSEQEFVLPLAARAGNRILVVGKPGEGTVRVSKFTPGEQDQKKTVLPRIADVLVAAAELGATYPDLVALLLEAESQHNLPGVIAIDALPQGGRLYTGSAFATGVDEDSQNADADSDDDFFAVETVSSEDIEAADQATPQTSTEAENSQDVTTETSAIPTGFSAVNGPSSAPADLAAELAELVPAQGEPELVR